MLSIKTGKPVDQVIAELKQAIEAQNMRLVTHINGQANAAKMGKTVAADQILEVFRPDFAIRVWQACKTAGMDIPLRIHVYEDAAGDVVVSYREASEIFAPYGEASLLAIAEELDSIFNAIIYAVEVQPAEMANG